MSCARSPASFRLRPLDLVFGFASIYALRALLWHGPSHLGGYDEGLLFANAQMLADGRALYRDFYSNYPPGIFQIVRMAMAATTSPIWAMRWSTFAIHVAAAACAARLVGRVHRRVFCLATFSFVLVVQADMDLVPYAYSFAVALVSAVLLMWPTAVSDRWRVRELVCAISLGLLSYLRHDVFVYLTVLAAVLEATWWTIHRRFVLFSSVRQAARFTACVTVTALALWVPVFARAGVARVSGDLCFDQVGAVMPARVLPLPTTPTMLTMTPVSSLAMPLPQFLVDLKCFALAFALLASCAALYITARALARNERPSGRTRVIALATLAALATLPQALGRADYTHVVFGLPLVAAAGMCALGRRSTQVVSVVALLTLFAHPHSLARGADIERFFTMNDAGFVSAERERLAKFIANMTRPHEPVFIGCKSHRRVIVSVMDLYYLAHRPGATRYMQFDPGLVTEASKQQEMADELERTQARLVLRFTGCYWNEPNPSSIEGASLLDEYLDSTYVKAGKVDKFDVWFRNARSEHAEAR